MINTLNIPVIVHQIWFNFSNWGHVQLPPATYDGFRSGWRKMNSEWTIETWNELSASELMRQHYPSWLSKFQKFDKPIQRADFFRWVALYHFGGCYVDMDCVCRRSLSEYLSDVDVNKESNTEQTEGHILIVPNSKWAMNAMIISTRQNPDVHALIEKMTPCSEGWMWSSDSVAGIFFSTGPSFVRTTLQNQQLINVSTNLILFDDDLMWHGVTEMPTDRNFVARHDAHGQWNFTEFLIRDVLKIIAVLLTMILILFLLNNVRLHKNRPSLSPSSAPQTTAERTPLEMHSARDSIGH